MPRDPRFLLSMSSAVPPTSSPSTPPELRRSKSLIRSWLDEAWRHKTTVLAGVLALISLSLAHYAGFLMRVPLPIVAVAGLSLAKGVTATFLFYVFFCAVLARVLVSLLQLITLPLLGLSDRLERGFRRKMDWSHQRRFVRSHTQSIRWEGRLWVVIQAIFFVLLMLALYVEFTMSWFSGIGLLLSLVFVTLSGLFRAGFFLQPNARVFIYKARHRPARTGRMASGLFVTVTAALVVLAFFMGGMRAGLLREQVPSKIVAREFSGMATVIANSDGALLIYQKQGTERRYIYTTPDFAASLESKNVFPPLGRDRN